MCVRRNSSDYSGDNLFPNRFLWQMNHLFEKAKNATFELMTVEKGNETRNSRISGPERLKGVTERNFVGTQNGNAKQT